MQILPRTEEIELIIYLSMKGEMLDDPAEPIYLLELDSTEASSTAAVGLLGKCNVLADSECLAEEETKKQKLPA